MAGKRAARKGLILRQLKMGPLRKWEFRKNENPHWANNKETQYNFKCYNHEKKIWDDNKGDNIKELKDLKMKINQILEQAD